MATVLLYLTDTEEGGETAFPAGSAWLDPASPQRYGPFSECAQGSVAVRPRKGAQRCQDSRCSSAGICGSWHVVSVPMLHGFMRRRAMSLRLQSRCQVPVAVLGQCPFSWCLSCSCCITAAGI